MVDAVEFVGERRESVDRRWATLRRCPPPVHTPRRVRAAPKDSVAVGKPVTRLDTSAAQSVDTVKALGQCQSMLPTLCLHVLLAPCLHNA